MKTTLPLSGEKNHLFSKYCRFYKFSVSTNAYLRWVNFLNPDLFRGALDQDIMSTLKSKVFRFYLCPKGISQLVEF